MNAPLPPPHSLDVDALTAKVASLEAHLERLTHVLRREAEVLRGFDVEALMELLPHKEQCLDDLLECDAHYRSVVIDCWVGHGLALQHMPDRLPAALCSLAEHAESDETRQRLERLAARLLAMEVDILDLQERNTALSRRSMEWIDACLGRLQRQPPSGGYDRRGRQRAASSSLIQRQA